MKKLITTKVLFLSLAFIGLNIVVKAQNVNIPDTNFKTYLLNNVTINTDSNGEISVTEATAYAGTIDVHNLSILDLTGIEAFTSLTSLLCHYNLFTSLDVSANISLTSLTCSHNSLTNLDVSANTALSVLDCDWNQFTNLDVSNNTALTTLRCAGYLLTSLDVSANTALTILDCSYNSLISLDISVNTVLTMLNCYSNPLTSLDISNNTALTFLKCNHNSLMSLNMQNGNNSNFSYFNATDNSNLICIQVDDTTYMNLNWSGGKDITASFNETTCPKNTISANVSPANSGNITGAGNYYPGEKVSLTAIPEIGYMFTNWTENGTEVSIDTIYSFIVTQDSTFIANFTITSDISDFNETNSLIIYPNPTTGKISINTHDVQYIEVIDLHGKQIYAGKETEIDLSSQPKGIYIIKVITDKQTLAKKLIKQ